MDHDKADEFEKFKQFLDAMEPKEIPGETPLYFEPNVEQVTEEMQNVVVALRFITAIRFYGTMDSYLTNIGDLAAAGLDEPEAVSAGRNIEGMINTRGGDDAAADELYDVIMGLM